MMQDALCGVMQLLCEDFAEQGGKSGVELIGLRIAQRRRQAALWVSVNQENFFSFLGKPDTEIFTSRGLSNPAFLVCYCNYCVRELSPPSNKKFLQILKPFTKLHLNHLQKNIKKAPLHKNDGEEDASIEGCIKLKNV
jgi:hypothetical protein